MLVKWSPFRSWLQPETLLDDLFAHDFPVRSTVFQPRIDVKETDKHFIIHAELPGLNKEDFKLSVENDSLILEGEKKYEHEEKGDEYYRSERRYGAFKRVFRLTDAVDRNKINAEYKNGVLTITLNKTEQAKPKEIEVRS
jgi:HSP20 family protein